MKNLQSNARNLIIYPGGSNEDVEGFKALFGQTDEVTEKRSISREVPKNLSSFEKVKQEIGLSEKPPAERESISEDVKLVERFTKEQLMYGPNVTNRNINSNTAFNFIFYRLIIKNSIQVPAVAKIEYIPYELKKASDKMIQAYESVLEKELKEAEEEDNMDYSSTTSSNADALGGKSESLYVENTDLLKTNSNEFNESDPSKLYRDKDGINTIASMDEIDSKITIVPDLNVEETDKKDEIPEDVSTNSPISFDIDIQL